MDDEQEGGEEAIQHEQAGGLFVRTTEPHVAQRRRLTFVFDEPNARTTALSLPGGALRVLLLLFKVLGGPLHGFVGGRHQVMDGVVVFLFAGGGVRGGGGFGGVGGGVLFVQNFAQEEKKIGLLLLLLTEGTDLVAKGSEIVGVFGLRHGRVLCAVPVFRGRRVPPAVY